ncbi:hypothetical protein HPB49_006186 [Dermacentor silvarum]|uniref:Uncharacterized protein n=1 Tax=Dermacentor silvarum TaxID=543639 RepID=A0ACB8CVP7_DERSI|nr:hypothetical protein HPB49_006186 [Dermacentor silvarum]
MVDGNIVNQNNRLALATKRVTHTRIVIIALDGHREVDVCHACERHGHRADVCPTPSDVVCGGCGLPNPDEQHQFNPQCKICGGPHPTTGKECAHRFKTPYIIRRRRFKRARQQEQLLTPSIGQKTLALERPIHKPTRLQKSLCLKIATHIAFSSALQLQRPLQVTHREQLIQQATIQEPHRRGPKYDDWRSHHRLLSPPHALAVKHRALDESRGDETVELLSEPKSAISNIQTGLAHIQEMIAHPQLGLVAPSARIFRLEETSHRVFPSTPTAQVPNLHSVISPPMEGAILKAALSQSTPSPNMD